MIAVSRRLYGEDGPIVFSWVNSAHQLGAGASAFLVAGLLALVVRTPRAAELAV